MQFSLLAAIQVLGEKEANYGARGRARSGTTSTVGSFSALGTLLSLHSAASLATLTPVISPFLLRQATLGVSQYATYVTTTLPLGGGN